MFNIIFYLNAQKVYTIIGDFIKKHFNLLTNS